MKIRRNRGARRVPRRLGLGPKYDEEKRGPPAPDTNAGKPKRADDHESA
jgi:hypothetical protein